MKSAGATTQRWTRLVFLAAVLLATAAPGSCEARRCEPPGPDQRAIETFVRDGCYGEWPSRPRHLSGAVFDHVEYAVHGEIEVFYSPGIQPWLDSQAAGQPLGIQDGEAIVALEWERETASGPRRALVKVRRASATHDGWFWSVVDLERPERSAGAFGDSACLSCHASAALESTFLTPAPPVSTAAWKPDPGLVWPDPPPAKRRLPNPLPSADRGFLGTYGVADVPRDEVRGFPPTGQVPAREPGGFVTSDQCRGCHNASQKLSNSRPNMWYPDPHSAPDDSDPPYRNYSPYGEWSASLHAQATRDPVWHAEVEAEVQKRPQLADFIYDTCFSCHAPMAGRQLRADTGNPDARFTLDMFYATGRHGEAKYGALARDGVSCEVCHRIEAAGLGEDLTSLPPADQIHLEGFDDVEGFEMSLRPTSLGTYTAGFETNTTGNLSGPYSGPLTGPMANALGVVPEGTVPQLGEAALCGSCHTIIVPHLPANYNKPAPGSDPSLPMVFEQTTYWEWRNSFFQNETPRSSGLPCQGCHMAPHRAADGALRQERIANIESARFPPVEGRLPDASVDLAQRFPYPRHTFLGINLFVLEMFQQFRDLLGSELTDPTVPAETVPELLTASDWMADHAGREAALTTVLSAREHGDGERHLTARVQVSNYAGHKFPTGAGVRRAFIEFKVLDATGRALWASGETTPYGVIVDGATGDELESEWTTDPTLSQPHYEVITRQDEVQIYESRTVDSDGKLQSSVLGIAGEYKDNRILPMGWSPEAAPGRRFPQPGSLNLFATHPRLPGRGGRIVEVPGKHIPKYCTDPERGLSFDRYYCDPEFTQYGADQIRYEIPLAEVEGWKCVEARVRYQSLAPYFLRDRLQAVDPATGEAGPATRRLIHIVSRMNWKDSPIENWTLQVGNVSSRHKDGSTEPCHDSYGGGAEQVSAGG